MAYYAAQSPRGFANEINVYRFNSRRERNAWVKDHADDGDCNSAYQGAYPVTAIAARRILGRKGDAATKQYNSLIEM